MSVMNTYSGRKFDPMKIAPEDVYLEDIADALEESCLPRWRADPVVLFCRPAFH